MAAKRHWPATIYLSDPDPAAPWGEHGVWVFTPIGEPPGWLASYRVIEQDGELIVAELRVVPAPHSERESRWLMSDYQRPESARYHAEPAVPAGGLSTRLTRAAVRIGEGLALARDEGLVDVETRRRYGEKGQPLFSDESLAKPPQSVGRRGRPDRYYAELAAAYVAAVETGSRRPVADVAEKLGIGYSAAYVRDALHRARQRELLTRSSPGRAGGRLTDKAIAVLTAEQEKDQ